MTACSGPSPILAAVYRGDDARLRQLLAQESKLDVFEAAADGWTPLHLAAFFGRADAVDVLLAAGADVRALSRNHEGNMPLHAALAGRGVGRISTTLLARAAVVRRLRGERP